MYTALSTSFQVNIFMAVTGITTLDVTTGKLFTNGYLYISWTDELLTWNTSDFSGLSRFSISPRDIWTPTLSQAGSSMEIANTFAPAWLYDNGKVDWFIGSLFEGTCILDVRRFPFDKHECSFFITPAAHDATEIQLKLLSNSSSTKYLAPHGEWEIIDSIIGVVPYTEPISGMTFVAYTQTLTLSRRYMFVVVHTSLPYSMMSMLNMMIFVVPLRSGERITFSITILLAFVFFTSEVSEQLPHNSLKLSYVSIAMATLNVATTLGIITSVILCRMDYENIRPLPDWLKRVTSKYLSYRRKSKTAKTTVTPVPEIAINNLNEIKESKHEAMIRERQFPTPEIDDGDVKWTHVANMLDYVFFYINFVLMTALGTGSFIVLFAS